MLTKTIAVTFKLLVFALLATCITGCKPPGLKALLDGQRLLEKGRPEAAIPRLEVATQILSTNANAWNYLGIAYHQAGQASNAVVAYKRALAVNPDLVETRLNLGSLWLEHGHPAEAQSEFTAYNLRRPNAPEGFCKIALAELHLRELAAAEQHARKSLQLDEKNPEAWNTLGLIQLQQRKPRDAAGSFGGALKYDPDYGPALINLAVVAHQQLGDYAGAMKYYQRYLDLKPRPADADAVAAVMKQLEGQLKPAKPTTLAQARPAPIVPEPAPAVKQPVATPEPKSTPAHAPQPQIQPVQSNPPPVAPPAKPAPEPARPTIETAVKIAPVVDIKPAPVATPASKATPSASATELANSRVADSGPPSPPPADVRPASRIRGVTPLPQPRNTVFVETTPAADSSREDGAATDASTSRRAAAQRHAVKGDKALHARRYVEAADAYQAATKADPDWFQAHFNLAAACIQAGRTSEAISACEQALKLKPGSTEARYNLALALKQAGRYSEAAAQLDRVIAADPKNARAHLTLGNLYADQLRQTDKARSHYLKVLEIDPSHPQASAIHFWLRENPAR